MVTAVLNVNAPPFYPSFAWHYHIDEQYYREHPFSPGKKGFVIADSTVQEHEVPDEELFDPSFHPVSKEGVWMLMYLYIVTILIFPGV
jgi:hypothetical protein